MAVIVQRCQGGNLSVQSLRFFEVKKEILANKVASS
jgi:hypothetical protein